MTELILEVFRLNWQLLAAGDELVRDIGLTSARWQVLGAVALSPVPLPVGHIARNMGLARQSVQRLVNEMSADELLRLGPNPHHQRAKLVLLTARGEAAYRATISRQQPWAAKLAAKLPPNAIEAATDILRTLRRRLDGDSAQAAEAPHTHSKAKGVNDGFLRRNG
jgi:DNA-binding MarR family transcriptional regulator